MSSLSLSIPQPTGTAIQTTVMASMGNRRLACTAHTDPDTPRVCPGGQVIIMASTAAPLGANASGFMCCPTH